jgi:DNA repair protein RecO (recombination protein O)
VGRDSSSEALVLALRQTGDDHRLATLFGLDRGVYQAMLFGGGKSRLRALVSPWHTGTVWLYGDAKKDLAKISDFDVHKFRPGIRVSLYKTWAATLACELVIKTSASGEYGPCWALCDAFFDGLDQAGDEECGTALIRFLWRYLNLMGLCPSTVACAACGALFSSPVVYLPKENGFICASCANEWNADLTINPEGLAYLSALSELRAGEVRRMRLTEQTREELKRLLFFLISQAAGGRLNTMEAGLGIL